MIFLEPIMNHKAFNELELRLGEVGSKHFPGFSTLLKSAARESIVEKDGVLLLGHTPEIAPEAYRHALYPPVRTRLNSDQLALNDALPDEIRALLKIMNGATLSWGFIELWGLPTDAPSFQLPAYELEAVEKESPWGRRQFFPFASTNSGDIVLYHTTLHSIRIEFCDPGILPEEFRSMDEWLSIANEVSYDEFA